MRRTVTRVLLLLLLWLGSSGAAVSTVRRGCVLGWDANTEPDLAGYRLYTSRVSGTYGAPTLEVTAATLTATCAQLGFTQGFYFLRVTAFDSATPPNESAVSTELALEVLVQVRVY